MPIDFNDAEKNIQCISKRITTFFERQGDIFEKWRPAKVILGKITENPDSVGKTTLEKFESIFKEVNKQLK